MRKIVIVLAALFSVLGVIFSFLPLDTIALLPLGLALIFSFITLKKSTTIQEKKMPKWLLITALLFGIFVIGKTYLIKDEVAVENQLEELQKIEADKKEAIKDLEDLE